MQSSDQAALLAHPQVAVVRQSQDKQEEDKRFGKVSGPSARHSSFVFVVVISNEKWKNPVPLVSPSLSQPSRA